MQKASYCSLFSPQSQLYMHLTNYSVNKHNENFERDETVDKGSKRSISWFTEFLRTNDYDVAKFWGDVSVRGQSTQNTCKHRHSYTQTRCEQWMTSSSEVICTQAVTYICVCIHTHAAPANNTHCTQCTSGRAMAWYDLLWQWFCELV